MGSILIEVPLLLNLSTKLRGSDEVLRSLTRSDSIAVVSALERTPQSPSLELSMDHDDRGVHASDRGKQSEKEQEYMTPPHCPRPQRILITVLFLIHSEPQDYWQTNSERAKSQRPND